MNKAFLCGIGRAVITPKVGCNLYGYSPDVISTCVNDDLTSTAFYFDDGEKSAMMISVTVCNVENDISLNLRKMIADELSIPLGNIILAAIHTHSGPNTAGAVGWGDIDTDYLENIFIPGILKSARDAKAAAEPVRVGVAQGMSYVGINRRQILITNKVYFGQNPWGVFDPRMTVISFKNGEGRVIGNIVHYGCHCTAAGKNTEISRDWAGPMIDKLEEISGGITAFFNGPEGDVGPRMPDCNRTEGKRTVADAIQIGGIAASDAVRIWRDIKAWHDAELVAAEGELKLPLRERLSKEEATKLYENFDEKSINVAGQMRAYAKAVMDSWDNGYVEQKTRNFSQSLIRIGDVAFTSYSFELFSEIAMRVDKESEIPYVLGLSNSNGTNGYFPTEDQICRGGYEIDMWLYKDIQPYCNDADYAIVMSTLENLKKLSK